MNRQRIYNRVRRHLLKQNKKSMNLHENGEEPLYCSYKADNGLKCAIGILIPDNLYKPEMEGKAVDNLLKMFPELKAVLEVESKSDINFLLNLQRIHDNRHYRIWEKLLNQFAKDNELEA